MHHITKIRILLELFWQILGKEEFLQLPLKNLQASTIDKSAWKRVPRICCAV